MGFMKPNCINAPVCDYSVHGITRDGWVFPLCVCFSPKQGHQVILIRPWSSLWETVYSTRSWNYGFWKSTNQSHFSSFPTGALFGCNFHFRQFLRRNLTAPWRPNIKHIMRLHFSLESFSDCPMSTEVGPRSILRLYNHQSINPIPVNVSCPCTY